MSRESLEKLREFVERHREKYSGPGWHTLLGEGHRGACSTILAEIDRLLSALPSEPTIEEAFEAGWDQCAAAFEVDAYDDDAPEPNCADWLKQRSGK